MKADWVNVVEAIGSDDTAQEAWARRVLETMRPFFQGARMAFFTLQHTPDCKSLELPFAVVDAPFSVSAELAFLRDVGFENFRALYYPPAIVSTLRSAAERMPHAAPLDDYLRRRELEDGIGVIVHPEPNVATVVSAAQPGRVFLDRARRRILEQVGLHIEAKVRLRRRPETIRAVVRADGRVLHRERGAPNPVTLSRHVRDVERARMRRHRSEPDAIDLWRALVAGTSSLVERQEGSHRCYVVVDNAPNQIRLRSLTAGEVDVVSYAARGLASKVVAYALGLAEPTVSSRLANAARKMGIASRTELVRIAAIMTQDPRASFDDGILTSAEREILELLRRGLSNGEIAAARRRSVRTIAHQVSRMLEKTRSPSRRALVARSAG